MAAAIKWTADRGYDLANLSLGKTGSTEVIGDAVRYASRRDVLLVGAAGNSEPCSDCVIYPAAHEVGIAISAVDCGGEWERYSSQGDAVELAGVAGRRQPPSAVDIAPSPARPLLPSPPTSPGGRRVADGHGGGTEHDDGDDGGGGGDGGGGDGSSGDDDAGDDDSDDLICDDLICDDHTANV